MEGSLPCTNYSGGALGILDPEGSGKESGCRDQRGEERELAPAQQL